MVGLVPYSGFMAAYIANCPLVSRFHRKTEELLQNGKVMLIILDTPFFALLAHPPFGSTNLVFHQ